MLNYHDYEKTIFDWLMTKHKKDQTFTFTVRQSAIKGGETDYFIGTQKSNYFATTFWTLPVAYAGSSVDAIVLLFWKTSTKLGYYFEFLQTKSPHDQQNQSVLNLIESLIDPINTKFGFKRPINPENKLLSIQLKPKEEFYTDIEKMLIDVDSQINNVISLVDEKILIEKKKNPNFKAHRVTKIEFDRLIDKLEKRIDKYNENLVPIGLDDEKRLDIIDTDSFPLNQILYGPPGTGKTYNTINKALEIINDAEVKNLDWSNRKAVKGLYQKKVEDGQIVFTTFHQSMSYEDFVEGIKPVIEESEDGAKSVVYEVKRGIFKRIVDRSKEFIINSTTVRGKYDFDDAWNDLVTDVNNSLEKKEQFVLKIQTPNLGLKVLAISEKGNLILKPIYSEDAKEYTVSYSRAKKLQLAFNDLSIVKNIDKEFRTVIGGSNSTAYWSVLNYINPRIHSQSSPRISETLEQPKPHVLIIDEINRGNVSAIFGELITLIEESKREGQDEVLEVVLPYSKEKFSVPSNLYIIGTMNTADRSVEALDTALRRRFSFVEMLPDVNHEGIGTVELIKLGSVLEKINKRLEKLLSRDHTIGHSFFINVNDKDKLYDAFYNKIIPLLQEYFFGDYGKIGLVLGNAFVDLVTYEKQEADFFANFEYEEKDMLFERRIYRIHTFDKKYELEEFLEAIRAI